MDIQGGNFPSIKREGVSSFSSTATLNAENYDVVLEGLADSNKTNYSMLDIGCGLAGYHPSIREKTLNYLKQQGIEDPQLRIIGTDLNPIAVEQVVKARQNTR